MHRTTFDFADRLEDSLGAVGPAWWPFTKAGLFQIPAALTRPGPPAVMPQRKPFPAAFARGPEFAAALREAWFDGPPQRIYRNAGEWGTEPCGAMLTIAGVPGRDDGGEVVVLPPGLLYEARRVLAAREHGAEPDNALLDADGALNGELTDALGGPGECVALELLVANAGSVGSSTPSDTLPVRAALTGGGQIVAAGPKLGQIVEAVVHACRIPFDRPALVVAPDRVAARTMRKKLAKILKDRPVDLDLEPHGDEPNEALPRERRVVVTAAGCGATGPSRTVYGVLVHTDADAAVTVSAASGISSRCRASGTPVVAVVNPDRIGGVGDEFLRDALVGPVLWDLTGPPSPQPAAATTAASEPATDAPDPADAR